MLLVTLITTAAPVSAAPLLSPEALTSDFVTEVEPVAVAMAREEDEEDDGGDDDDGGSKKSKASTESESRIREVVRGFYAKANVGAAAYLLGFAANPAGAGQAVSAGTMVGLAFGQDFVDNEKQSMAWEVGFNQGVHNGLEWTLQGDPGLGGCVGVGGAYPCTEGDLRTYSLQANYEFSVYPTRRFGIGFRAGAGALFSPLLLDATSYTDTVVPAFGTDPLIHNSIHPYGFAGPSFEYYTKLAHFSVGFDVDVFYAVGWDLGLNASGALKYTF